MTDSESETTAERDSTEETGRPRTARYSLAALLALTAAIGMAIQLAWQLPEVWPDPYPLVAAAALLVLGIIVGRVISHSASTRNALAIMAILFYLFLGYQWSSSFRDDYLIWSFRWMCLGFLASIVIDPIAGSPLVEEHADEEATDQPSAD